MGTNTWIAWVSAATASWAAADICCDVCIEDHGHEALPMTKTARHASPKRKRRRVAASSARQSLSAEQTAFLGGLMCLPALLLVPSVSCSPWFAALALAAGVLEFLSYYYTLCAYNTLPSTVITPLLQLSQTALIPASLLMPSSSSVSLSRQAVHLLAIVVTTVGGILPAAHGDPWLMFRASFWAAQGVWACCVGEALSVLYSVAMHLLTYERAGSASDAFVVYSKLGNGIFCVVWYTVRGPLRRQTRDLYTGRYTRQAVAVALLSQVLALLGSGCVTYAYASYYNPAVVNTMEGGLQQAFNLVLAYGLYWGLRIGRPVDDLPVKLVSLVLVCTGLAMASY